MVPYTRPLFLYPKDGGWVAAFGNEFLDDDTHYTVSKWTEPTALKEIVIGFFHVRRPVVLCRATPTDSQYRYILIPMKAGEAEETIGKIVIICMETGREQPIFEEFPKDRIHPRWRV